ncbi:MAG TPA: hypothetical protein VLG92_02300 [Candidatus Saccharimonadia bacterium]|nr:hypothetical protein [Candidatus Saccharimonadia bacterium]
MNYFNTASPEQSPGVLPETVSERAAAARKDVVRVSLEHLNQLAIMAGLDVLQALRPAVEAVSTAAVNETAYPAANNGARPASDEAAAGNNAINVADARALVEWAQASANGDGNAQEAA